MVQIQVPVLHGVSVLYYQQLVIGIKGRSMYEGGAAKETVGTQRSPSYCHLVVGDSYREWGQGPKYSSDGVLKKSVGEFCCYKMLGSMLKR